MCSSWLSDIIMPLLSAGIGGLVTWLGVKTTLKNENQAIKEERIEKSKPILINHTCAFDGEEDVMPKYTFASDGNESKACIRGIFKNTDCGIAFIDKITTEKNTYLPQGNSTVDKNTPFVIELNNLSNETLKFCRIFCHDILGNSYCYDGKFVFDANRKSKIEIGNIQILNKKNSKCKRGVIYGKNKMSRM